MANLLSCTTTKVDTAQHVSDAAKKKQQSTFVEDRITGILMDADIGDVGLLGFFAKVKAEKIVKMLRERKACKKGKKK